MRKTAGSILIVGLLVPILSSMTWAAGFSGLRKVTERYYNILLLNHQAHELSMVIDTDIHQAYIMAMGHELFRMQAKYVDMTTPEISIADNWIELRGNGRDKLYLDIAKEVLFFLEKDGWTHRVFAHVRIRRPGPRHLLWVEIPDHGPISLHVMTAYKKALVYFDNHELFIMHAKKVRRQGQSSGPLIMLKYMNRYEDGIYLDVARRILLFRSGEKGVFAPVRVKISTREKWK